MVYNKYLASIFISVVLFFSSCDSAYEVSYIFNNTSNDTIIISYKYQNKKNSTVKVLPHERKEFLADFIIRKASTFGDCCPCTFESISTSDSLIDINDSSRWILEKQDKDKRNDEGFVNCIFTY